MSVRKAPATVNPGCLVIRVYCKGSGLPGAGEEDMLPMEKAQVCQDFI